MTSKEEALEMMRSYLLEAYNLQDVSSYCHERAIREAYGGDEGLYVKDSHEVDDTPVWSSLVAARHYLYYQVYTMTMQELLLEAVIHGQE